jgi:hypothetical protein
VMGPRLVAVITFAVVALGLLPASHASDTCATEVRDAQSALARALRGKRDVESPRLGEAEELVRHAEAACQQGDVIMASRKAQEALGVLNRPPGSWQGPGASTPPSTKTPGATRPGDADSYPQSPSVSHEPMFIGPTGKTQTGEFGASAWIAPNTPVGSEVARGQQGGTPAVGFTFTWGGPARRSESIQGP